MRRDANATLLAVCESTEWSIQRLETPIRQVTVKIKLQVAANLMRSLVSSFTDERGHDGGGPLPAAPEEATGRAPGHREM